MRTSSRDLTQAVVALLAASTVSHALSIEGRATTCNGHPVVREIYCSHFSLFLKDATGNQFCDRSYGNISFVGTHDSYAVGTNNRESYDFVKPTVILSSLL